MEKAQFKIYESINCRCVCGSNHFRFRNFSGIEWFCANCQSKLDSDSMVYKALEELRDKDRGPIYAWGPSHCKICNMSLVVGETICHNCINDPVNHPSHYNTGKIEVIDVIEDWALSFHLANAVKYIARAGKKDPAKYAEDLKKAAWYVDRAIKHHEGSEK